MAVKGRKFFACFWEEQSFKLLAAQEVLTDAITAEYELSHTLVSFCTLQCREWSPKPEEASTAAQKYFPIHLLREEPNGRSHNNNNHNNNKSTSLLLNHITSALFLPPSCWHYWSSPIPIHQTPHALRTTFYWNGIIAVLNMLCKLPWRG